MGSRPGVFRAWPAPQLNHGQAGRNRSRIPCQPAQRRFRVAPWGGPLSLSANSTNPTAKTALPSDDHNDSGAFDLCYLQRLKLVVLDFHVARMLRSASSIPAGGAPLERVLSQANIADQRADYQSFPVPPMGF